MLAASAARASPILLFLSRRSEPTEAGKTRGDVLIATIQETAGVGCPSTALCPCSCVWLCVRCAVSNGRGARVIVTAEGRRAGQLRATDAMGMTGVCGATPARTLSCCPA